MFQLIDTEELALRGTIVVLTPHPIAEVLGCGGLIAEAAQRRQPLHVTMVTHSAAAPDAQAGATMHEIRGRDEVRRTEALTAIERLGGSGTMLSCLDLPAGGLAAGELAFGIAVDVIAATLREYRAATLLAPWRSDPHPDYEAVSRIAQAAAGAVTLPVRRLEYAIWAWVRPTIMPLPETGMVLDVTAHTQRRQWALAAHRSQIGTVQDGRHVAGPPDHLHRLVDRPLEVYFTPDD